MALSLGRVTEVADSADLFACARHPATQTLLSAVPIPDPIKEPAKQVIELSGDFSSPMALPSGCAFRCRCTKATEICARVVPALLGESHQVACHQARWGRRLRP